jgi:hypothetical protein
MAEQFDLVCTWSALNGQPGMTSTLHKRENDNLAVSDWRPVEMLGKDGGYRHQHGPMMAQSMLAENPISLEKLGA